MSNVHKAPLQYQSNSVLTETGNSSSTEDVTNTTPSSSSSTPSHSFVDYTPPPEVEVLPPAKYKLWLIVFVLVYFASWVSYEADLLGFLRFDGWLSPNASLFVFLGTIVFVLVYSTLDLVITCLTFTTKSGKEYGLCSWLKQPRAQWMYRHENLLFEILARVVHILENGFAMFDAPPSPVQMMKQWDPKDAERQCTASDPWCEQTLKIEHRIRPDKLEDYKKWLVRIRAAAKQADGLLGVDHTDIRKASDEEEGGAPSSSNNSDDNYTGEPLIQVAYIKFRNIDALNDWMLSPRRKALMKVLEPILVTEDTVKIQQKRHLPDAFTDLLTPQGQAVPKSPPKKWKVWWITLVALFITFRWTESVLPYYYDKWGLSQADLRVERIVSVLVSTFMNSYVTTPFLLFLFDHWVQHRDAELKNVRQPWKALDEGFPSIWPKVALTVAFYGGCMVAALFKK